MNFQSVLTLETGKTIKTEKQKRPEVPHTAHIQSRLQLS